MTLFRAFVLAVLLVGGVGCAGSEESTDDGSQRARPVSRDGLRLAATAPAVRTVQLFAGDNETSLPILRMREGPPLTLTFDLVEVASRALSVYFEHADRVWRRDLVPAEYLASFHRDDLLDYQTSRASQWTYVHYRYRFPNGNIQFRLSGNYILRVTEQGMEDDVLFERAFFVSEQAAPIQFDLDPVMVPGAPYSALQPTVWFTPPDPTRGTAYDYTVCFFRNGVVDAARCSDRPSLAEHPTLRYFLEPETSFLPDPTDFFLDLSSIRPFGTIERIDRARTPWLVVLKPDFYRFPGTPGAPLLNGQAVVTGAVRDVSDPATAAEYVDVDFSLVPDGETPVPGTVHVVGSFNGYRAGAESRMTWSAARGRYEVRLPIKQGKYEYRYVYSDAATARGARGVSPRFENSISALVYFDDVRAGTDRLLAAASVMAR